MEKPAKKRARIVAAGGLAKLAKRRIGRPPRAALDDAGSREKLIDRAIELFARHGYDPVSTKAVAEAAELTQSMVHYHFGSKEALWRAAIDLLMRRRGRAFPVMKLEFKDVDPATRLKILIRRLVEANVAEPNYARIVMHEAMARTARLEWLIEHYVGAGFEAFDKAVALAIEAKQIRKLPIDQVTSIVTSATVLTFSIAAVNERLYGVDVRSEAYVQSFSDTIIDILFEGLTPR